MSQESSPCRIVEEYMLSGVFLPPNICVVKRGDGPLAESNGFIWFCDGLRTALKSSINRTGAV